MKLPLLVAVLGFGITSTVSASGTAIDQQVDNFFSQGIKHCKNAMDLSRTSREIAKAEFDRYQSYISKVEALKPELKEDIMVRRQMEQCDQVGHDIARNEALPVFEQSLAVCKEIKGLVSRDHLSKAKAKFVEYRQFRDQALNMTDTVLKVGSNASKARRCDRMEDRIAAAEQRIQFSEIKADRLVSTLRKSTDSCMVSVRMLGKVGHNLEKLNAAEEMLSQAKSYFKQSQNYPEAIARAENYPGFESSKKIRQYMVDYGRCEQNMVTSIAQQKQEILAMEKTLSDSQVAVATVNDNPVQADEVDSISGVLDQKTTVEAVVAVTAPAESIETPEIANPYAKGIVEEGLVQMSHEIE